MSGETFFNQCLKTSTKLVSSPLRKLQSPNLIYIALLAPLLFSRRLSSDYTTTFYALVVVGQPFPREILFSIPTYGSPSLDRSYITAFSAMNS